MPRNSVPFQLKKTDVADSHMSYIDEGEGDPVVFLHGNPTSSYLWRNVIPPVTKNARAIVPDLIGMGESGRPAGCGYRFADHARYLDAFLGGIEGALTLVVHDWGGGLGFHWAHRHPERVKGIAYMETIVMPVEWDDWPEAAQDIFKAMRSDAGEEMILEKNLFIEAILPSSMLRTLDPEEMEAYREPFREPGEGRLPMLVWPREVPLGGEPQDVAEIVDAYSGWMADNAIPKLYIDADPGSILVGRQREFCSSWPAQERVQVKGLHFIQEDSPTEIGTAVARWHESLT